MAFEVEIDVEVLKSEIKKTYTSVSQKPEKDFIFPTGRLWAEDLGYPPELASVPETAVGSFAGVANPWQLGRLAPGERVLDLGSGAGTDSLVAAQMVGERGHVTGIDMTQEMLTKARAAVAEMGAANVECVESEAERLPFPGCELRRRDLERRYRPDPRQGRGVRGDLPSAHSRWADPDRGCHDPESGQCRGAPQHRPLDRLNCRRSAGSRVRRDSEAARVRADRERQPRCYVHALEVRGYAAEGNQVRCERLDGESLQASGLAACSSNCMRVALYPPPRAWPKTQRPLNV